MYMIVHLPADQGYEGHWVLVRMNKTLKKVEIFESAKLVTTTDLGWQLLRTLVSVGAIPHCSGWTVVLYNARVHGMPRQHDGVSCGVFACIIAEHLIAGRRLPHSLQANIGAWRLHIAMKVWGQRRA
jgi:Ulp1 family protease